MALDYRRSIFRPESPVPGDHQDFSCVSTKRLYAIPTRLAIIPLRPWQKKTNGYFYGSKYGSVETIHKEDSPSIVVAADG